jgi:hypothetical protein
LVVFVVVHVMFVIIRLWSFFTLHSRTRLWWYPRRPFFILTIIGHPFLRFEFMFFPPRSLTRKASRRWAPAAFC